MVGLGEVCLAKLSKRAVAQADVPKLAPRWTTAVFLGYSRDTHEYFFHARGRVIKSRALQRVPLASRWSMKALEEVHATPYSAHRRQLEEAVKRHDEMITTRVEKHTALANPMQIFHRKVSRRLDFLVE